MVELVSSTDRDIAGAYWEGAIALEGLALSLEQLRETAFALASSETYEEGTQHAFYCLGELAGLLHRRAKKSEDRLTELFEKHR